MAEGQLLKAVTIKRGTSAPAPMRRGTAAFGDGKCYFMSEEEHEVRMYDVEKDDWSVLRQCPYKETSLAVIDGVLTSVGGMKGQHSCSDFEYTERLYSLSNRRWIEKFPPMNHDPELRVNLKKRKAAVVQTGSSLIVIAGRGLGETFEDRVDVLDTKSSVWSEAPKLPKGTPCPTAAICGDELYVMDGSGWGRWVKQCFLDELIGGNMSASSVWSNIADAPVEKATCASLCGQLVAIGGRDDCPAINAYDSIKDCWYEIGKLTCGRSSPLVVQISENTLVVVGGKGHIGDKLTEIVTGVL